MADSTSGKKGLKALSTLQWLLLIVGLLGIWAWSIRLRSRKTLVQLDKDEMTRDDKVEFILKNNGADVIVDSDATSGMSGFDGYGNGSVVYDVLRRDYVPVIDHVDDGYVIHMFHSAEGKTGDQSKRKLNSDIKGAINGEELTDELLRIKQQLDKMSNEEIDQAFDVVRYRLLNKKQKVTLSELARSLRMDAKKKAKMIKRIIPTLKQVREVNKTAKSGIKNNRRVYKKGSKYNKLNRYSFPDTEAGKYAEKLMREKIDIEDEIKDLLWLVKRKGYGYTIKGNKDTGLRVVELGNFSGIGITTPSTPQQDVNRINDLYLQHRMVRLELIDLGYGKQIAKGKNSQGYGKGDVVVQGRKNADPNKRLITRTKRAKAKDRRGGSGAVYSPDSLNKLFS